MAEVIHLSIAEETCNNVVNVRPGPTALATNRVIEGSPSSLRVKFSEAMLRNIQKCTDSQAQRVTGNANWNVMLHELDNFIGFIITRSVLGQRGLPCLVCGIHLGGTQ